MNGKVYIATQDELDTIETARKSLEEGDDIIITDRSEVLLPGVPKLYLGKED